MKTFILTIIATMSLTSIAGVKNTRVVYGDDNRQDIYAASHPLYKTLANSTAGMVSNRLLRRENDGSYSITRKVSLEDGFNICPSERFSQQPLLANCSGFLVGDDILITAGHCYQGMAEGSCQTHSWVFGLEMQSRTEINLDNISKDNVYRCKKVIKAVLNNKEDFSVIQLDRKVVNRKPLKYRTEGKVSNSAELVVIGHPTMMPLKASDGGTVLYNTNPYQFTTTLDTFQGNSGSAVFNAKTGLLEGILVSGKTDYIPSDNKNPESCKVVNVCDMHGQNCMGKDRGSVEVPGENVTRITTVLPYIPTNK